MNHEEAKGAKEERYEQKEGKADVKKVNVCVGAGGCFFEFES